MSDSMVLNGLYELIDQSTGTPYELLGEDLGAPVADIAVIEGTLLDGDSQTGDRSSDRSITLPVQIVGADKLDVGAKASALMQVVDQAQGFTLTWTPDGGKTIIFDCKRGDYTRPRDANTEAAFITAVTLTFNALPFGRSSDSQSITVPASGATAQVQIDGMNSGTYTNGTLDSTIKFEGTDSLKITLAQYTVGPVHSVNYGYTNAATPAAHTRAAIDISAMVGASIRLNWPAPGSGLSWLVTITLILSSSGGSSSVTSTVTVTSGSTAQWLVTFDLTRLTTVSGTGVDLTAVTGWKAVVGSNAQIFTSPPASSIARLDDLRAYPAGSASNSTAEGSVLTVPAVVGTARASVNLEVDRAGSTFTNVLVHRPPNTQDPDLAILIGLLANTETVPAPNMNYEGTYNVLAIATFSGGGARTVTVTFTQKLGATTLATASVAGSVTSAGGNMFRVGRITLPLVKTTPENTSVSLVVTVTSSNGADTFSDVILCDTKGQSMLLTGLASTTEEVFLDEPDPLEGIGQIYSSATDRTGGFSVLGPSRTSGGPMLFEPGDNRLLVASGAGAPGVTVSYYPRWLDERLV